MLSNQTDTPRSVSCASGLGGVTAASDASRSREDLVPYALCNSLSGVRRRLASVGPLVCAPGASLGSGDPPHRRQGSLGAGEAPHHCDQWKAAQATAEPAPTAAPTPKATYGDRWHP